MTQSDLSHRRMWKTVFEWLLSKTHSVWLLAICVLVSLAAIVVHAFVPSPWCLLQGFSGLMFLALGWWMKNKKVPKWVVGVALLCWPLAIIFSNMEVADLHYKILPLDVMGACGGTLCMWWLSKQIARVKWLTKPLSWCGVFSLVILCFHNFEWFSAIVYSIDAHLPITIDGNGMVVFRYLLTFVLALAAIKLPYVRSVYGVKLASLKRS